MELQDFVAETLKQIVKGVKIAQKDGAEAGAKINPEVFFRSHQEVIQPVEKDTHRLVEKVEFDVAVTETKETKTKGGIGVLFAPIMVGTQGQSDALTSSVNRIRFSVPLVFPPIDE